MVTPGPLSIAGEEQLNRPGVQALGDERRAPGDEPRGLGTIGARVGLSGVETRALLVAWPAGMALVLLITAINIMTRRHDMAGQPLAVAVIDEGSSAVLNTVALLIPAAIAVWLHRGRRGWAAAALVHAIAAPAYSALHVGGFVALRTLAYAVVLQRAYHFGSPERELPYEFGKDVLAYLFSVGATLLILRWSASLADRPPSAPAAAPSFDIRDGARLVRAPVADILAIRSAGNYAEFLLRDGRRPLMRSPLADLEAELGPRGFVRTHRSWLVNRACVTGLRPEGSGDYAVELGSLEAPISRRYRAALEALRG